MDDLVTQALALPETSRAFLAEKLLESLEQDDDFPLSDQWRDEIRRRCAELDVGEGTSVPAAEVFSDLRQRLG